MGETVEKTLNTVGSIMFGIFIVSAVALGVASIVIAKENASDASDCKDSNAVMDLYTWLMTLGVTQLVLSGVCILGAIAALVSMWMDKKYVVVCFVLFGLFVFCWDIIGWIVLFRDNSACRTEASRLFVMTMVQLCVWSVTLLFLFCYGACNSKGW